MRVKLAAFAAVLGLGLVTPASAQEAYRVDVDVSARIVCAWNERTQEKMAGLALPFSMNSVTDEETSYLSVTALGRDGPDLLVADVDPKYPDDIVFLRFSPGGELVAAAFDQGSLEQFALASRERALPLDQEAQSFGYGLYEATIDGRTWTIGDLLYTQDQLDAWSSHYDDTLPIFDLEIAITSQIALVETPLSPDGRRQLVFAGPMAIVAAPADPLASRAVGFQAEVDVRAVIDQATGHLVEVRESSRLTGGDPAAAMTYSTTELTASCRTEPGI